MIDEETVQLATLVCSQTSLSDAYDLYRAYLPMLKGWRFVFSSENGVQTGLAVSRSFAAGAVVKSAYQSDSVFVLDELTVEDMARLGRAEYPIDFSISLDTEALSYIHPHLVHPTRSLPQDFQEVFAFLAKNEVNCDAWPYQLENLRNLRDSDNYDKVYKRLRAYQVLRFIDASHLEATGGVRSALAEEDLNKEAQEMLVSMLRRAEESSAGDGTLQLHCLLFCLLLKIILLKLAHPRETMAKKLFAMAEFMDQSLSIMMLPEGLLAQKYFLMGQNLRFFGKVQTKKPNLLRTVNGMAWDLVHRRNLDSTIGADLERGARYFFPAILTFDKGFAEVMDLYSLRACASHRSREA